MLQTELHQVKATAALLKVHNKQDLYYEAYTSLLFSTASDYDSKHGVSKGKRQVYAHDLEHDDADLYDASYEMDPLPPSSHLAQRRRTKCAWLKTNGLEYIKRLRIYGIR
jgi:hypothetical protein